MNALKHFVTIHKHRKLVRKGCFKVGLYYQGIMHDMSKYFPSEFLIGIKYYQGFRSPNSAEREDLGYSSAWLHHKGRNKHHFEYWTDYIYENPDGSVVPIEMPTKYLVEMVMDRIAASKTYKGTDYNDNCPLQYLQLGKNKMPIHPKTLMELEKILTILAEKGEEYMYEYIRKEILRK